MRQRSQSYIFYLLLLLLVVTCLRFFVFLTAKIEVFSSSCKFFLHFLVPLQRHVGQIATILAIPLQNQSPRYQESSKKRSKHHVGRQSAPSNRIKHPVARQSTPSNRASTLSPVRVLQPIAQAFCRPSEYSIQSHQVSCRPSEDSIQSHQASCRPSECYKTQKIENM